MKLLIIYGTQFLVWYALCFGISSSIFYIKKQSRKLDFCISSFIIAAVPFTLIVFLSDLFDKSLFHEIIAALDKTDNIIFLLVIVVYIVVDKLVTQKSIS